MMTDKEIIHNLRNPYGKSAGTMRETRLQAATRMEQLTAGEKGLTMNAEKITKRLINYEKLEKEANDERCRLIQTAESAYRKATKPGKDYEKKLMEGLKPKIDKWLESETECECECCREYPDKMYPTTEGIFIRFDADHPNDIRDYTIPYEDLDT